MPLFHIIAVGPPASGKTVLIRHFANTLPEGYKLKRLNATIPEGYGQEYWTLSVEKLKKKKAKAHAPS